MVRLWRVESRLTPSDSRTGHQGSADPSAPAGRADSATDRLVAAFIKLLSEHWVQSEKLANLVQLLGRSQVIDLKELEALGRGTEDDLDRDQAAADFVRRILEPLGESGKT